MSKLDPRPASNRVTYSWEHLNQLLQSNFNTPNIDKVVIDLEDYSMSAEEIIAEAKKQGYKCEKKKNFLYFT